MKLTDLDV